MKRYFVIISILGFSLFVSGQGFNGGITAGLTICQIDGDANGGFDKAGFSAGVFVNRKVSDSFTLNMELKYTMKGANSRDLDQQVALHYMEIPLFAEFNLGKLNLHDFLQRINVEGGLAPAVLFHYTNNGYPLENDPSAFDISGLLGVNFQLFDKVKFSVRYTYSIIELAPLTTTVHNEIMYFSFHYFFLNQKM